MAIRIGEVVDGCERSVERALRNGSPALTRGTHTIVADEERNGILIAPRLESRRNGGVSELVLSHEDVVAIIGSGDVMLAEGVDFDRGEERVYVAGSGTLLCVGEFVPNGSDRFGEKRYLVGCISDGAVCDTVLVVSRDGELLLERGLEESEVVNMAQRREVRFVDGVTLENARLVGRSGAGLALAAL